MRSLVSAHSTKYAAAQRQRTPSSGRAAAKVCAAPGVTSNSGYLIWCLPHATSSPQPSSASTLVDTGCGACASYAQRSCKPPQFRGFGFAFSCATVVCHPTRTSLLSLYRCLFIPDSLDSRALPDFVSVSASPHLRCSASAVCRLRRSDQRPFPPFAGRRPDIFEAVKSLSIIFPSLHHPIEHCRDVTRGGRI